MLAGKLLQARHKGGPLLCGQGKSTRRRMTPKFIKKIGSGGESFVDMKCGDTPRRTPNSRGIGGSNKYRHRITLDQARGNNANDAMMPAFTQQDKNPIANVLPASCGSICFNLSNSRCLNLLTQLLALAVAGFTVLGALLGHGRIGSG